MVKVPGSLSQWRLRFLKFEFYIIHRTGIAYKAAHALLRFKTNTKVTKTVNSEISVISISQKILSCASKTEITDFKFIEEPRDPLIPFIPKVCVVASITGYEKAKILTLPEYILEQSTDEEYCSAFTFVGKPSSCFTVESGAVLVQVSP